MNQRQIENENPACLAELDMQDNGELTRPASEEAVGGTAVDRLLHLASTILRLGLKSANAIALQRLQYHVLTGREMHSGAALKVAYIGDMTSFGYVGSILFDAPPEAEDLGRCRWWSIGSRLDRLPSDVDLLVVDVDFPITALVKIPRSLAVPRWIKQRIPISDNWPDVMAQMRRKTRKEAQRYIRKYGFTARIIKGSDGAADFYDALYLPYIRERHGVAAEVVPRQRFLAECRRYLIIELCNGDQVLAGSVLRVAGDQLSIVWAGLDTSQDAERCRGATDALDFYTLQFAYQRGCRYVDMGPSRARLNDGVFVYKKKWGAEIYQNSYPQAILFFAPQHFSESVQSVFAKSRFIVREADGLGCRILAAPGQDGSALQTLIDNEWDDSLSICRVFTSEELEIESGHSGLDIRINHLNENALTQFVNS
jgi:hypothetical protein